MSVPRVILAGGLRLRNGSSYGRTEWLAFCLRCPVLREIEPSSSARTVSAEPTGASLIGMNSPRQQNPPPSGCPFLLPFPERITVWRRLHSVMTAEENICHAEVCLKRANEAEEVYVRVVLKSGETSNDRFAQAALAHQLTTRNGVNDANDRFIRLSGSSDVARARSAVARKADCYCRTLEYRHNIQS